MMLKLLLLIATLAKITSSEWQGCGTNNDAKIYAHKKSAICVVLSGPDSWQQPTASKYSRFMFTPKVDSLTKLEIANSWVGLRTDENDLLIKNFTNPSVHVESGKALSYIKRYRGLLDDTSKTPVTWPYMTAIINVDEGDITGITWDDGCYFCENHKCQQNTFDFKGSQVTDDALASPNCYLKDTECQGEAGKVAENCPMSIYVVWTGSDGNGKLLKSAEMRFSQYKSYSVMNFIADGKDSYEDVTEFDWNS